MGGIKSIGDAVDQVIPGLDAMLGRMRAINDEVARGAAAVGSGGGGPGGSSLGGGLGGGQLSSGGGGGGGAISAPERGRLIPEFDAFGRRVDAQLVEIRNEIRTLSEAAALSNTLLRAGL